MIIQYSFPSAKHGAIQPIVRHVTSERSPDICELVALFEIRLKETKRIIDESSTRNDADWRKFQEIEDILFCLNNIHQQKLPTMGEDCRTIAVPCQTRNGSSSIQVTVLDVLSIEAPPRGGEVLASRPFPPPISVPQRGAAAGGQQQGVSL